MFFSIPSTCFVDLFVSAVIVYTFASFIVSSFKVFLFVTLIFATSGLLSKLSTAFSNAKPLMTFSVGHTHIYIIRSTNLVTAKETFSNDKHPITRDDTDSSQPRSQSYRQLQHSESSATKRPFGKTDDLKEVNGGLDSSSSKLRRQSNKQQHSKSSGAKRPNFEKTDDQNREKDVNAIRVLKTDSVSMNPTRKEGFSNSKAVCKDSVTERTRGERTSYTLNTRKDATTAQKIVNGRLANNDLFQELYKLEDAIHKLMEPQLGLIPDWNRSKQIV